MLSSAPVLLSALLLLAGAETPAETEDERPVYYGSEVVVVSDRPDRFEPFMPGSEALAGNLAEEIARTPHVVTGGYGASVYPAVRGLSAEHVGFEYDGVPLNSLQNGLADLALFEVLELDATVVRGPFARTAAGRPAQAAVSLRPRGGPDTGLSIAAGSQRTGTRASLRHGDLSFRVGFFSDDGYADKTSAGGFGLEVGGRTRWGDAALTYVNMDRGVPGPGPDWPYGDGSVFAGDLEDELVIARAGLNPVSIARPGFYLIRQEQDYRDSTSEPTHITTSAGAIVELDLTGFSQGTEVTAAFDRSRLDSRDALNPNLGIHQRTSASLVGSHTIERGSLQFAVEGAGSYTNDFDAAMTGALAAAYVSDPLRAWVSWGRSYRAPTMNELYWPEDAWTAGNEDLEPESVTTLEAGVEAGLGILSAAVTAYSSDASELISWVLSEADWKSRPVNVGEADLRGVELEFGADLGEVGVYYAASFASAEDVASGMALPYRPETSQWLTLSSEIGRVNTAVSLRLVGEVYSDTSESSELSAYGVVDWNATIDLPWTGLAVRFEGLNITDTSYETRRYYEMPGREWRATLLMEFREDA